MFTGGASTNVSSFTCFALASLLIPLHPASYWQGWEAPGYGTDRVQFGIHLELGGVEAVAPPMFMAHLSYLGLDPHQVNISRQELF